MRIAGHDHVEGELGFIAQRRFERGGQLDDVLDLLFDIHAEIERDLVIAAARGMELFAGVADALGQDALDVHVDIFIVDGKFYLAVLNVGEDGGEASDNLVCFFGGDDVLLTEHLRVRHAALDILAVQAVVELNGGVEVVYKIVRLFLKASGPKLHICHTFYIKYRGCARRKNQMKSTAEEKQRSPSAQFA